MKKLLLIEDNPLLSGMYQAAFQKANFAVDVAADGASGLAKIADTKPDGVLLDLMMPGIDGFGVLETIKDQQSAKPKIIVLTVVADEGKLDRARELGALECLNKSQMTLAEIVEKVSAHLA
jgi:DNA-binding response OmpR family regulator